MESETKIEEKEDKDFEEIVRIGGQDIDGKKSVVEGIKKIRGVGHSFAHMVISASKFKRDRKIGFLKDEEIKKLENIIKNPEKFGIPSWSNNRQKSPETGKSTHLIEADLEMAQKFDIRRMKKLKSYKGIRHSWGLPVRGQKTKTSFRRGSKIGVSRKKMKEQKSKKKGGAKK